MLLMLYLYYDNSDNKDNFLVSHRNTQRIYRSFRLLTQSQHIG